jgi:transcription elongation factor Elf1
MELPNLNDCSYFKKSVLNTNGRSEKLLIYRLKGAPSYRFVFVCPMCSKNNELAGELKTKKIKEGGKTKEYIFLNCNSCNAEFKVEKFKARKRA